MAQELEGASPSNKAHENEENRVDLNPEAPAAMTENTGKAIWALGFSGDGKYLAAAGQDRRVRIWAVISSPADRNSEMQQPKGVAGAQEEEEEEDPENPRLRAPVFMSKPVQIYEGHTGSILDLSWSKVRSYSSSESVDVVRRRLISMQHDRTISFLPRLWTKRFGYGMSREPNVCAVSSTVTLSLPSSFTHETIDSS